MTCTSFSVDYGVPANDRLQVGRITPGFYLMATTNERLRKDRVWVTCIAYIPCPMNPWTGEPMERTRHPIIEIDGREVDPENLWDAWVSIAKYPITHAEFLARRGLTHAGW